MTLGSCTNLVPGVAAAATVAPSNAASNFSGNLGGHFSGGASASSSSGQPLRFGRDSHDGRGTSRARSSSTTLKTLPVAARCRSASLGPADRASPVAARGERRPPKAVLAGHEGKGGGLPTICWGAVLPPRGSGGQLGPSALGGSAIDRVAAGPLYALWVHDGSWNPARPTSELLAKRRLSSTGFRGSLVFGVCSMAAAAAVASSVAAAEADVRSEDRLPSGIPVQAFAKDVYKNYKVIGIRGDGRCLFRAVCRGLCLQQGMPVPSPVEETRMADDLRRKVVDEFEKRREDVEWFIEGDFAEYMQRMRRPSAWGGEPELLMASHVLRKPITVYIPHESGQGLISIAEYGQEYGKAPVHVLYNGSSHYDVLDMPLEPRSNL